MPRTFASPKIKKDAQILGLKFVHLFRKKDLTKSAGRGIMEGLARECALAGHQFYHKNL